MAVYGSTHINLKESEFRLLRLRKAQPADPVQCDLFVRHLPDFPDRLGIARYKALSYVWGDPCGVCEVVVNGHVMMVTENLHSALIHLRSRSRDRILWIDAICINQNNLEERGHQVQQMREIYERAEQVVIWLGEGTAETDIAIDSMNRLGTSVAENGQINWESSDHLRRTDPRWRSGDVEKGLVTLLNNPWFRRVWIIQEAASSRDAVIVCGRKVISPHVLIASSHLTTHADRHCRDILDTFLLDNSWKNQAWSLQMLLKRFQGWEASDPRDRIYALLGLASDARDGKRIRADYTKTLHEVIRDTTLFLLSLPPTDLLLRTVSHFTIWDFFWNVDRLGQALLEETVKRGYEEDVSFLFDQLDKGVTGAGASITELSGQESAGIGHEAAIIALFYTSAQKGHAGIVRLLLDQKGIDVNQKRFFPWGGSHTALSISAQTWQWQVVKLLLQRHDLWILDEDHYRDTRLYQLVKSGYKEILRRFIGSVAPESDRTQALWRERDYSSRLRLKGKDRVCHQLLDWEMILYLRRNLMMDDDGPSDSASPSDSIDTSRRLPERRKQEARILSRELNIQLSDSIECFDLSDLVKSLEQCARDQEEGS